MNNYIALARKYRPADFSELSGQEVLTKILNYSIIHNRFNQVHLLTGMRGVGKTSAARIIAKTINCTNKQQTDLEVKPCKECQNCQSLQNHKHPDVIETDAASKTSVDHIRQIIESSEYRPLLGRYKVFIIDEVHMLSKSAFNALLKIIEEPPVHTVFIFATTEAHKIPLTILSRCQRYDLRRLNFSEILKLITDIAAVEGLNFTKEALEIIASKSEGSARDAISMLDQAANYLIEPAIEHSDSADSVANTGSNISAAQVNKMLGLIQIDSVLKIVQLIINNDPVGAIKFFKEIYYSTSNLEYFINAIADFIAELTKAKIITNYHNPLHKNYLIRINDILVSTNLAKLSILWQIFASGSREIKSTHNEFIFTEMLLIKAIYAHSLPILNELDTANTVNLPDSNLPNFEAKINKIDEKVIIEDANHNDDILAFLKYCHKRKELEIYYFLFNEVEISKFAKNEIKGEINGEMILNITQSSNPVIITRLKELLLEWSGKEWNIITSKQESISSLKMIILDKAKSDKSFQMIKNNFPTANISDILLVTKISN